MIILYVHHFPVHRNITIVNSQGEIARSEGPGIYHFDTKCQNILSNALPGSSSTGNMIVFILTALQGVMSPGLWVRWVKNVFQRSLICISVIVGAWIFFRCFRAIEFPDFLIPLTYFLIYIINKCCFSLLELKWSPWKGFNTFDKWQLLLLLLLLFSLA